MSACFPFSFLNFMLINHTFQVYARAAKLFSSQPDLMDDFEQFFGEEAGSFSSERPSVAPSSLVASRSGSSTPKNAFKNQVDLEANGPQVSTDSHVCCHSGA